MDRRDGGEPTCRRRPAARRPIHPSCDHTGCAQRRLRAASAHERPPCMGDMRRSGRPLRSHGRPHRLGERGGGGGVPDGRSCSPPPATTGRCGCGTPPPATHAGDPLTGHTGAVSAVARSAPGRAHLLATTSDDRTVRMWDPATGHPTSGDPLTGHTDAVDAVARSAPTGGPCSPPPAATGRCGCGTPPPATQRRRPADRPHQRVTAVGRPRPTAHPARHRQRRPDGAAVGPRHRHPGRRPLTGHTSAVPAVAVHRRTGTLLATTS